MPKATRSVSKAAPATTQQTLYSFLAEYRQLVHQGNATQLRRLRLLLEIKEVPAIWQTGPYSSWARLLRDEHLVPLAYFKAFELATQLYKPKVIDHIGSDAAVVLARVEEHLRPHVLDKIEKFIHNHKIPPQRGVLWSYIRSLRQLPLSVLTGMSDSKTKTVLSAKAKRSQANVIRH